MDNNTHLDTTNTLLENAYIQATIFHERNPLYGVWNFETAGFFLQATKGWFSFTKESKSLQAIKVM